MFNIGLGEILFIAILALVFIGPERLPKVMRQMGEVVAALRKIAADFNREFSSELEPIRELQSFAADIDPRRQVGKMLDVSADAAEQAKRTIAPPPPTPPTPDAANPMAQISSAMQAEAPAPPPDAESDPPAASDPDPDPAA